MDFEKYVENAWARHGDAPAEVLGGLEGGLALATTPENAAALAQLTVHVTGEHLGLWLEGVERLGRIRARFQSDMTAALSSALDRGEAILRHCEHEDASLEHLPKADRIRVLAVAASALQAHGNSKRAIQEFRKALALTEADLERDPAVARTLAVSGNNLACALEEKEGRDANDTELMLLAAKTGRKFWEIAGTWLEVERAEYRLAKAYLAAGDPVAALDHAALCLKSCRDHQAEDLERFYAHECLAACHAKGGDLKNAKAAALAAKSHYDRMNAENQESVRQDLVSLERLLEPGA